MYPFFPAAGRHQPNIQIIPPNLFLTHTLQKSPLESLHNKHPHHYLPFALHEQRNRTIQFGGYHILLISNPWTVSTNWCIRMSFSFQNIDYLCKNTIYIRYILIFRKFLSWRNSVLSREQNFLCPSVLVKISIPIAVVLRCPFKISSTAVAVYLHRPMQYICSEKPMRWPDKLTALTLPTHRIAFFQHTVNPPVFLSCWICFSISLRAFFAPLPSVRSWNLWLSESRVKLAWTMPSVSKLNNVKQVIRLRSSKTSYIFLNEVWSAWRITNMKIKICVHLSYLRHPRAILRICQKTRKGVRVVREENRYIPFGMMRRTLFLRVRNQSAWRIAGILLLRFPCSCHRFPTQLKVG